MSGQVGSVSATTGSKFWFRVWRPGVTGVVVFIVLAIAGFLINQAYPAGVVMNFLGVDRNGSGLTDFFLEFLTEPVIRCVIALIAGFLFPRGFYLWGVALVLHTPLSEVLIANRMVDAGYDPYFGGTAGMLNYLLVSALFAIFLMLVYTCFSALGMLARYLLNRRSA